jgi:hypothetical protein
MDPMISINDELGSPLTNKYFHQKKEKKMALLKLNWMNPRPLIDENYYSKKLE